VSFPSLRPDLDSQINNGRDSNQHGSQLPDCRKLFPIHKTFLPLLTRVYSAVRCYQEKAARCDEKVSSPLLRNRPCARAFRPLADRIVNADHGIVRYQVMPYLKIRRRPTRQDSHRMGIVDAHIGKPSFLVKGISWRVLRAVIMGVMAAFFYA